MLEHQMLRLRWATYASKKLEYENGIKGTIHKKDDDAPDSLRYFMTLMPDLKFDNVEADHGAPLMHHFKDAGTPIERYAGAQYKQPDSIYEVYESESNWGFEN
jgi:hypothetical protein